MRRAFIVGALLGLLAAAASAQALDATPVTGTLLSPAGAPYELSLQYELGFAKVLANTIQIGQSGTNFNYVTEGGEELLVPYTRYQAELGLWQRSHFVFLYQPLLLHTQSRVPANESVTIDDVTFPAGSNLDLTYSFPFWRVSYLYDVVSSPRLTVGVGASLQLRNASIQFATADGKDLTISQNLGPVPVLKVRAAYRTPYGLYFETDVDGFYASSAFLNGATFSFEGSILDASLRAGIALKQGADAYLNLRFIGGTATGNSQYAGTYWSDARSTYTDNRLATLEVSLGARIR